MFEDDAAAALDGRRHNPVWQALLNRAGGPTLRVSAKLLEVAVRIAAHDKRINDDAWRLLEPGRKELLLPLGEEGALRQAAQRVVAMKMSQRATRAFVREKLAADGRPSLTRPTPRRFHAELSRFNERLGLLGAKKRLEHVLAKSTPEEKKALRAEVERVSVWAKELLARLRGRE